MDGLTIEPLFVDRAAELAHFDRIIDGLGRGIRQHTAILGLRRIGKTLLLDEVERRHPGIAFARMDADAVASDASDFARAMLSSVLRGVLRASGDERYVGLTDDGLRDAARAIAEPVASIVDDVLGQLASATPGRAVSLSTQFPAEVGRASSKDVIVMIDEFQEIARLAAGGAPDVIGALRVALDRPGRALFVVAGSRVTAMRRLVEDGSSPLFTRFASLDLPPFARDATHELAARVWEGRRFVADAADRLHHLTGGWPFYAHTIAARASTLSIPGVLDADVVDAAFQSEIIGRVGSVSLHCQYLLRTATAGDDTARRNRVETILRRVAREPRIPRARLARALARRCSKDEVYDAVSALIAEDFVVESGGLLRLGDPVFAVWLNVEDDRQDPLAAASTPGAIERLIARYEAQHQADRTEMGVLYERAIENLVRQFGGQTVSGVVLGAETELVLPVVDRVTNYVLNDPSGLYADGPDAYEVEMVTSGPTQSDRWAIECKHRAGAITRPMVERFVSATHAIERESGQPFARRWIVAPRGIRGDALAFAREAGVLHSGKRDVERLVRRLAGIDE
ncbi:MAG: ATP-binding protein [Chloroflexota bacterium]|nr:MAG: ATP-binding protein [Chloroflexota bacterium]